MAWVNFRRRGNIDPEFSGNTGGNYQGTYWSFYRELRNINYGRRRTNNDPSLEGIHKARSLQSLLLSPRNWTLCYSITKLHGNRSGEEVPLNLTRALSQCPMATSTDELLPYWKYIQSWDARSIAIRSASPSPISDDLVYDWYQLR